ncbi:fimbrial protein, partial [Dysgonomonas sp. UBA7698]|uniref:fimbrial protein n=2 Tax=unclassified Dysgonomonas TaxID=2630389 RepID=UPI0032E3B019
MISNMVINRWNNKFLKILVFICVPIFICGCKDDREDYNYSKTGKETTVSFSVRVPGAETPKTYALDLFDENEVRTIEILLFNSISGEYIKNPIYSNTISDNPENIRIKTFTVKVLEGTYDMIVLANSRQSLTSILNDINAGDSKASVLEKLLVHNTGKWNTDSGSNEYIAIPMWGE